MKRSTPIPPLLAAISLLWTSAWLNPAAAPSETRVTELMAQARELEAQVDELHANGREEAAREARQRLEVTHEELVRLKAEMERDRALANLNRGPTEPQRRIQLEIRRLEAEGRFDQAERVRAERLAVMAALEQEKAQRREMGSRPAKDRPRVEGPRPGVAAELERRLHHAEIAADNLRAAGMPELAEHAARAAMELRMRLQRNAQAPLPSGGVEVVRELQQQIEQLQRAMRDMQEKMERLQQSIAH